MPDLWAIKGLIMGNGIQVQVQKYFVDPANEKAPKLQRFEVTLFGLTPGNKERGQLYQREDDLILAYPIRFDYCVTKAKWESDTTKARVVWVDVWPWSFTDNNRITKINLFFLQTRGVKLCYLTEGVQEYWKDREMLFDPA